MSPDTIFKIILKDLSGSLDPLTNKPYRADNSKGEPVPVAFTVACEFNFGDDLYGDYIAFLRDEPGQEAIGEAAETVFGLALKSYKMLRAGVRDVPMHQVYVNEAAEPIKTIEPAEEARDETDWHDRPALRAADGAATGTEQDDHHAAPE